MIKTTFYLAIPAPDHLMFTRTIEMPYKVMLGDEIDVDGDDWIKTVESIRFNMETESINAILEDEHCSSHNEQKETKELLFELGWKLVFFAEA